MLIDKDGVEIIKQKYNWKRYGGRFKEMGIVIKIKMVILFHRK